MHDDNVVMTLFGVKATVVPDYEVTPLQDDSISALAFAPTSDLLAVSSWSGEVRLYETGPGKAQPKAAYQHEGPVLSVVWSKDGSKCLSGGTDKVRLTWTKVFHHLLLLLV